MIQVRDTFVPRKGWVFAQADYGSLELCTLAQYCVSQFGYSKLADALNEGKDPHVELGAEIAQIPVEDAYRLHKAGDKTFKKYRQLAKAGNFGLPGGLGVKRFVDFCASSGAVVTESEARNIKAAWMRRWPEVRPFFEQMAELTRDGEAVIIDPFTGRVRGGTGYTNGCNDRFQSLGAAVAKRAMWLVSRACYAEPKSVMFGSRIVNFIHDELILETPDTPKAHDVAMELERLMISGAKEFLKDVRITAPPTLQRYWSKNAVAVYDANGRLIPWGDQGVDGAR